MLSHDFALPCLVGDDLTEWRIGHFLPVMRRTMMETRFELVGKIVVRCRSLVGERLIRYVTIGPISNRFPKRHVFARGVGCLAVNVPPVALVTKRFLFLRCALLHTNITSGPTAELTGRGASANFSLQTLHAKHAPAARVQRFVRRFIEQCGLDDCNP